LFTGEGEVFYKQIRVGKNNKDFPLFKFATMIKNSPNIGAGDITIKNDPRVLPFGKLLRKTKLNEFPQFINVLIGNMSIVGPRPLVRNQFNMIPNDLKKNIICLKPGITGVGSIIFRDEETYLSKSDQTSKDFYEKEIVPYKAALEKWYYLNQSIIFYFIIILFTGVLIVYPKYNIPINIFKNLPKHPIFNSIKN
tara:strand:+ start:6503 stop:7087 length:585 start_codon:yes stop_codon:yes gene_type:complete